MRKSESRKKGAIPAGNEKKEKGDGEGGRVSADRQKRKRRGKRKSLPSKRKKHLPEGTRER